jgi:hypothetical protein
VISDISKVKVSDSDTHSLPVTLQEDEAAKLTNLRVTKQVLADANALAEMTGMGQREFIGKFLSVALRVATQEKRRGRTPAQMRVYLLGPDQ